MAPVETPCIEWPGRRNAHGYGERRGWEKDGSERFIHRWVVAQVEPLRPWPEEIVMHRCDNPPCFRYDHLVRATQGANIADMYAKGRARHPEGDASLLSKITDAQVAEVRRLRTEGLSQRKVAALFDVSRALVRKIERGEHR